MKTTYVIFNKTTEQYITISGESENINDAMQFESYERAVSHCYAIDEKDEYTEIRKNTIEIDS